MAKKKAANFSFDTAYQELEGILQQLQSEESLDNLESQVKKATELILACKGKLRELDTLVDKTINPDD